MTVVGFTGTQQGMTDAQRHSFKLLLPGITEFHHGDCIGADAEAHEIVFALGIPIVIHPPLIPTKRAFCSGALAAWEPRPYLDRNHDIVKETQYLIATPKTVEEQWRSGTWATIRYAKKQMRHMALIRPDGVVVCD